MWLESAGMLDNKKYELLHKMSGGPHIEATDVKTPCSRVLVTSRDSQKMNRLVRCCEVAVTVTVTVTVTTREWLFLSALMLHSMSPYSYQQQMQVISRDTNSHKQHSQAK